MLEYKEYSRDLWDYLVDMPYMPSRQDRDRLLNPSTDNHRVQIWDYFFRVKPEDVGKPQQNEIESIRKSLGDQIKTYNQKVKNVRTEIENLRRKILTERLKRSFLGVGGLVVGGLSLAYFLPNNQYLFSLLVSIPLILFGLITAIGIGFAARNERRESKELQIQLRNMKKLNESSVKRAIRRIKQLEVEILELRKQIPELPQDEIVSKWLRDDFKFLQEKSKEKSGLSENRLAPIKAVNSNSELNTNPILVLGPGELQHEDLIPPTYTKEYNIDLNKHLTARQAFYWPSFQIYDVLYGVYYIEYILIADDMLATYGLFFDFITGNINSEHITEQYYKDVVAIATANQFRKIMLGLDSDQIINIEDAPTFTLSLASGETREVTFVNKNYFMGIKDKINIDTESIAKIELIETSRKVAENAIQALRGYLRKHKGNNQIDSRANIL